MSILFSHFSQGIIVFIAAITVFALLFAVFPKAAWTNAYIAGEQSNTCESPSTALQVLDSADAPQVGRSAVPAIVGIPLPLSDLITANGQPISAAEDRYHVTLNECIWLGTDGDHPSAISVSLTDDTVTFPDAGLYRLKVTVSDNEGLKTTAYLYTGAGRKGF